MVLTELLRNMSGHHNMAIKPSRWQWNRFKDFFHFYLMLGLIPSTLLVLYVNLFIGPAKLAEIPEGYIPEPYEYHSVSASNIFSWIRIFCNQLDHLASSNSLDGQTCDQELPTGIRNDVPSHLWRGVQAKAQVPQHFSSPKSFETNSQIVVSDLPKPGSMRKWEKVKTLKLITMNLCRLATRSSHVKLRRIPLKTRRRISMTMNLPIKLMACNRNT